MKLKRAVDSANLIDCEMYVDTGNSIKYNKLSVLKSNDKEDRVEIFMEPKSDKLLSGSKFWKELVRQLSEAEIPFPVYYKVIGQDMPGLNCRTYRPPKISQMPALFEYLKTCPAQVFDMIGRNDYLLPETRGILEIYNHLDRKTIKGLTEAAYTTVGSWMYDSIPNNPCCRLLLFVEHHIIPSGPDDLYVYNLKLKYRTLSKKEITSKDVPEWMIGNCRRLPFSDMNFDIEQWIDVANFLKCSLRWIYGYDRNASFYGYTPEAETLYDIWSLATPEIQKMLINVAKFKLQGV